MQIVSEGASERASVATYSAVTSTTQYFISCLLPGTRVSGLGVPAGAGSRVSELPQGLGLGSRVLGTAGGQFFGFGSGFWSLIQVKTGKISSWSEAKLHFFPQFCQKFTGRTPSHLWYFRQRCWFWGDLTDFSVTILNYRYIRGARSARQNF